MPHYPEGAEPATDVIEHVVEAAIDAIEDAGVPYLLMGGASAQTFGRPRHTDDLDVFVRPDDAPRTLDVLAGAGFTTERTYPSWLFKAMRQGVLVDIIFRSSGDIYLDDEMLARGQRHRYLGAPALIMSPEDLLVIKVMATTEETAHHWYDALALIARRELDWPYVVERARVGPARVLSLLLFAESAGLSVPPDVVASLYRTVHPSEAETGS